MRTYSFWADFPRMYVCAACQLTGRGYKVSHNTTTGAYKENNRIVFFPPTETSKISPLWMLASLNEKSTFHYNTDLVAELFNVRHGIIGVFLDGRDNFVASLGDDEDKRAANSLGLYMRNYLFRLPTQGFDYDLILTKFKNFDLYNFKFTNGIKPRIELA